MVPSQGISGLIISLAVNSNGLFIRYHNRVNLVMIPGLKKHGNMWVVPITGVG